MRSALGLLNATSTYRDGISVVIWMGRVGNRIGLPCGASAPEAGSIRNALTWCSVPTGPVPGALLLEATYRYRPEACGHAYCTLAGSVTEARFVSAAASTSTS